MLSADEYRKRVVEYAISQETESDPTPYWLDALGGKPGPYPPHWCGAFALTCLHRAGLALTRTWAIGKGLTTTLPRLTVTRDPQPGDIAYFAKGEHMAVVIGHAEGKVSLVNGNGVGKRVVIDVRPLSSAKAYYSIARYIDDAQKAPQA